MQSLVHHLGNTRPAVKKRVADALCMCFRLCLRHVEHTYALPCSPAHCCNPLHLGSPQAPVDPHHSAITVSWACRFKVRPGHCNLSCRLHCYVRLILPPPFVTPHRLNTLLLLIDAHLKSSEPSSSMNQTSLQKCLPSACHQKPKKVRPWRKMRTMTRFHKLLNYVKPFFWSVFYVCSPDPIG